MNGMYMYMYPDIKHKDYRLQHHRRLQIIDLVHVLELELELEPSVFKVWEYIAQHVVFYVAISAN